MARKPLEYVTADLLQEMAEKLIDRYPEQLGHINADSIYFAFCISKKPKNSHGTQVTSARKPLVRKIAKKLYQIAFFKEVWDEWEDNQKYLHLLHALYSIDIEMDGSFKKNDVSDFYQFVYALGPLWQKRSAAELPHPLDEKIDFVDPPCDDDIDVGSSTGRKEKIDPVLKDIIDEEKSKEQSLKAREEMLKNKEEENFTWNN